MSKMPIYIASRAVIRSLAVAGAAAASFAASFAGGCANSGSATDHNAETFAVATNVHAVTLKTIVANQYVTAENGGGGAVNANRVTASTWETFSLTDLNGGDLVSGDLVTLATNDGAHFVSAENGGGSVIDAIRTAAIDWETFRVVKVGGTGAIASGNQIALQTKLSGQYVSAVNGGGAGVTASAAAIQSWETFVIGIAAASGGAAVCTADQLPHCNCPSDFSCCPIDGSCFQNPSDIQFTMCKDNPSAACAMSGAAGGGGTGGGGGGTTPPATRLRVTNQCTQAIWVAHSDNVTDTQNVKLTKGQSRDYQIPAGGLSAIRFWPKTGCDASGHNCAIGDSGEGGGKPCPTTGCQAPLDSKFEASFAATGSTDQTWYNLSQVDGYTLPFKVQPFGSGAEQNGCVSSDCSRLSLAGCPGDDDLSGGGAFPQYAHEDLRVRDAAGNVVACAAPCKKINYPAPYGLGQPENVDPGLHMCCPTPVDPASGQCTAANGCMTSESCRAASDPRSVVHTDYVAALHAMCPSAYAFSYDDANGLHACPSDTSFEVTFCP